MNAVPIEVLLEHADWVRDLARRLVRDEARADDAVQETWVEALRNPPKHDENPRGWLASVLRNAVRRGVRGDGRRVVREAAVAPTEAQPASGDLVERARLQRELAGHVLDLREPYRTALLLRWFEGLSQAEIAAQSGVGTEVVHARLRRGHALLRERLDAEYGDRSTWCTALVTLAEPLRATLSTAGTPGSVDTVSRSGSSLPTTPLGLGTGTMIAITTGSLAALGLTAALLQSGGTSPGTVTDTPGEAPLASASTQAAPDVPLVAAGAGRTPVEPASEGSRTSASSADAVSPWAVRGRVVGAGGVGLGGAGLEAFLVRGEGIELLGETEADGEGGFRFELRQLGELTLLERLPARLELRAFAPGHLPRAEQVALPDGTEPLAPLALALRPGVLLIGRVLDESGLPVAGAPVHVTVPVDSPASTPLRASNALGALVGGMRATLQDVTVRTGADGSYRLGAENEGRLVVTVDDDARGTAEIEVEGGSWIEVPDLVIERRGLLGGRVQLPDGSPATGVAVTVTRVLDREERERRNAKLGAVKGQLGTAGGGQIDLGPLELAALMADGTAAAAGRDSARTTTDANGEFLLGGLAVGNYAPMLGRPGELELAPSGTLDLLFVVDEPTVTIELRDGAGRPLPGYQVRWEKERTPRELSSASPLTAGAPTAASELTTRGLPAPFVASVGDLAPLSTNFAPWAVASGPDASVRIPVEFGQRVRYEVIAPGVAPATGEVVLSEGEWNARRTLVLEPALPPGSLSLTVTDPEGKIVPELRLSLTRRDALSGSANHTAAGDGVVEGIAVGEWTVVIHTADPALLPATRQVFVGSGEETELAVALERGAFLELEMPELPASTMKGDVSMIYGAPTLILASGETLPLVCLKPVGEGEFEVQGLAPGRRTLLGWRTLEHPALPPGQHELVMRPVGNSRASHWPVSLVAGETDRVSFQYPDAGK